MADLKASMTSMRPLGGLNDLAKPGISQSQNGNKAEFRDALQSLQQEALGKAANAAAGGVNLKFSNHAIERMQSRGISFSPEEMKKVANAVDKAAAKGSKNALLFTDTSAMIVSIKDNTVVTVMDRAAMKDNVFTNIDSTVMI